MSDRPAPAPASDTAAMADIAGLVAALRGGERRALARAMTMLERWSPEAPALLKAMQPHLGRALLVGITGPPGAGKSSLVNALIGVLRAQGRSIGVIAVDPSSPVSGGAILGDRIRMTAAADDDGVFVRSLASRGYLGGLSPAAVRVVDALDAAGKDVVLIETVGTGQSEVDIAEIADVRVVVSAPGLGDGIQAMKAGLLEIADILVVNKSDREGAERTAEELLASLSLGRGSGATPVLRCSATTGAGIAELAAAIDTAAAPVLATPALERRRRRARYLIARAAADLLAERIRGGGGSRLEALCGAVLAGELSPAEAATAILNAHAPPPSLVQAKDVVV